MTSKTNYMKALGFVALLSLATPINALTLDCTFTAVSKNLKRHVTDGLIIEVKPDIGFARVRDNVATDKYDWVNGKIARENGAILSVVWRQPAIVYSTAIDPVVVNFRLSFRKKKGSFILAGITDRGFTGGSARGRCAVAE